MLLVTLLTLPSCQYRWGSARGSLKGSYCIEPVVNQTDYRLIPSEIQSELVRVIRRQRNCTVAPRDKAEHVVYATIVGVYRRDQEIEALTANVAESQLVIELEVRVEGQEGEKTLRVRNTDYKEGSGTFRDNAKSPIYKDGISEGRAGQNAVKDCAEAIVQAMEGSW